MAYRVKDVARYMVCKAHKDGAPISNLKLQKLLYFAWKEYYEKTKESLFYETFEAWQFGPVIRSVYYEYCAYGPMPIRSPRYLNYDGEEIEAADKQFFDEFLRNYQEVSVSRLVEKTHEPNGAWAKVFKNGLGIWDTIDFRLIKADCENARC